MITTNAQVKLIKFDNKPIPSLTRASCCDSLKIESDLEAILVTLVFAQMASVAVSSCYMRSSRYLRQEGEGKPPALGCVVNVRSEEIGGALLAFELRIYRGVSAFDAGEPVGQETVGSADRVLEL